MCCFLGILQPLVPDGLPGGLCDSPPPPPCSTIWLTSPKSKWTCIAAGDLVGAKRALGSKLPSLLILVTFFGRATWSSPGPSLRAEDRLGLTHPGLRADGLVSAPSSHLALWARAIVCLECCCPDVPHRSHWSSRCAERLVNSLGHHSIGPSRHQPSSLPATRKLIVESDSPEDVSS